MKVKIFISDHCNSCIDVIHYFERRGIPFELIDVTYDQAKFNEMLQLGGIATPYILVGNCKIHSFDRLQIEKCLEGNYGKIVALISN